MSVLRRDLLSGVKRNGHVYLAVRALRWLLTLVCGLLVLAAVVIVGPEGPSGVPKGEVSSQPEKETATE